MHALEVLSCVGGSAPLGKAAYELRLSADSATASGQFAARAAQAYALHIKAIAEGRTRLRAEDIDAVREVFEAKISLNEAFMQKGDGQFYYEFISDHVS